MPAMDNGSFINTMLMGVRDYASSSGIDFIKSLIYMDLALRDMDIDNSLKAQMVDGLKNEFDNVNKSLPDIWKYFYGYTKSYKDVKGLSPNDQAEVMFVKLRMGDRILFAGRKLNSLLDDYRIDDLDRAIILALISHTSIPESKYRKFVDSIIERNKDNDLIMWILTSNPKYFKDNVMGKYYSWLTVK